MTKRANIAATLLAALGFVVAARLHGLERGLDWLMWFPLIGATFNKFQSFVEAVAEKVHNLGADVLTVFLTTNANAPVATNSQLSNITQIAYTNMTTRAITISTSAQTTGTYKLVVNDLVITQNTTTSATFRWVGIYNDTATNDELVAYFDYGSDITLAPGETLTLDFDGTNGLLTIGP